MKKILLLLVIICCLFLVNSCNKSSSSTTTTTTTATKILTAKVNGTVWTGTTGIGAITSSGLWNLTGSTSTDMIHLVIYTFSGTGTYNIDGITATATYGPITSSLSAVSGSIVVTSSTAKNVQGTFYYTTTDSTKITNGVFNVDL